MSGEELHLFSRKIDGAVDVVDEGARCGKGFEQTIGEISGDDLGRGGGIGQTEVAQAKIFAPGGIFVKTFGVALEGVLAQESETRTGGLLHESIEIAVAVDNVFAQGCERCGWVCRR